MRKRMRERDINFQTLAAIATAAHRISRNGLSVPVFPQGWIEFSEKILLTAKNRFEYRYRFVF